MTSLEQLSEYFDRLPLIEPVLHPQFAAHAVHVDCLRLDAVHPEISGNKWFKLRLYLEQAMSQGGRELLSFGGGYSNHLHALAYAANLLGLSSRAAVCGHEPAQLSPTLLDCQRWGMQLSWLDRKSYREQAIMPAPKGKHINYPGTYVIPEGGEGLLGVQGVQRLFERLCAQADFDYDYVVLPVGTGTTMAGVVAGVVAGVGAGISAAGLASACQVIGVSALKNATDLESRVRSGLHAVGAPESRDSWQIEHNYHFGGFAKQPAALMDFVSEFEHQCALLLDPVYTAKAMFAVFDLCELGVIAPASKVLFVHTGGLQGRRS